MNNICLDISRLHDMPLSADAGLSAPTRAPMRCLSDRLADGRARWTSAPRADCDDGTHPLEQKRYWFVDAIGAIRRVNMR